MMEKLIYKISILDKEGLNLGIKGCKLSFLEIYIIKEIGSKKEYSIFNLVKETGIDRSSVTAIVNKLVLNRIIEKEKSKEDKRIHKLILTNLGEEIYDVIVKKEKEVLEFILNDITLNEEKAALKFLSKINQKLM